MGTTFTVETHIFHHDYEVAQFATTNFGDIVSINHDGKQWVVFYKHHHETDIKGSVPANDES